MRAAKKRALLENEEPNLYDEEAEQEEEETENTELDPTNEEEGHTNGSGPTLTEYLETENEEELRDLISKIDDVVEELLDVPEWKVTGKDGKKRTVQVLLRTLNTFERTSFIKAMMRSNNDIVKVYPDLVILSAHHPKTGKRLFHAADRGMLQTKMGRATERIALRASELNGLTEEAIQEMRKNSRSIR
jgi:hypothetical protein